jgi:hypothetical protein
VYRGNPVAPENTRTDPESVPLSSSPDAVTAEIGTAIPVDVTDSSHLGSESVMMAVPPIPCRSRKPVAPENTCA